MHDIIIYCVIYSFINTIRVFFHINCTTIMISLNQFQNSHDKQKFTIYVHTI